MGRSFNTLPLAARRTFRLAASVSLALAVAYGAGVSMPHMAPLLAFFLGAQPSAPMPPAKLLVIAIALAVILGTGILAAPLVQLYPPVGLTVVALGLFFSSRLSISGEKAAVGTILAAGLTLVSAVGTLSLSLAEDLIFTLVTAVLIAVVSQWVVWPFFSETTGEGKASPAATLPTEDLMQRAMRAVVIIMPAYLFLLVNPTGHTPVMMKSIVLAQTGSSSNARAAALELLGATLLGGALAMTLWMLLKLVPNLWMFALWVALLMIAIGRRLYTARGAGFSVHFWMDTTVTCLILLGSAVQDSASGKDPYQGFAVRFGVFSLVSLYAWGAYWILGRLRMASRTQDHAQMPQQVASE